MFFILFLPSLSILTRNRCLPFLEKQKVEGRGIGTAEDAGSQMQTPFETDL